MSKTDDEDDEHVVFSEAQAARFLVEAPTTLARWRKEGAGPAWYTDGRGDVFYRRKGLREWLKAEVEGKLQP